MEIVFSRKDVINKQINYLVKTKYTYEFVLNTYKTSKNKIMPTTKIIRGTTHPVLVGLLNKWTENATNGSVLFNDAKLSSIVSKMNRAANVPVGTGAINAIRQMTVSDAYGQGKSTAELNELADLMMHSAEFTQQKYNFSKATTTQR
jgi:hypothetical protein